MQTTLRIDDEIFREAKAKAAREGISLTRFIEDALRLRLRSAGSRKPSLKPLPVFDSGVRIPAGFDLPAAIREAESESESDSDSAIAKELLTARSTAPDLES